MRRLRDFAAIRHNPVETASNGAPAERPEQCHYADSRSSRSEIVQKCLRPPFRNRYGHDRFYHNARGGRAFLPGMPKQLYQITVEE